MKLVYVYRSARPGGFSIEAVFKTVAVELRKSGITVIDYELRGDWRLLLDVVQLRRLGADIYHVTGDVNYLVALLPWSRSVLTVHDIGHYLYGLSGWRKNLYRWLWLIIPIRLASRVTVVSEKTRDDLVTYLGTQSAKIEVVADCYSPAYFPRLKPFDSVFPRILQVGTGKNKNAMRLIQALVGINCTLVVIGKANAELIASLKDAGIPYENHVDLSQDQMVDQYAQADLVSFVSTSEGFGMPIIEAQAMGKPLITAAVPPMSSVAGPGACLVDPLSIADIRAGIVKLIQDDDFRAHVVASGLRNVRQYSAGTVASRYLEIYQRMLQAL
jgi:glycosyltransferase involved in cell wall biosynthesis